MERPSQKNMTLVGLEPTTSRLEVARAVHLRHKALQLIIILYL